MAEGKRAPRRFRRRLRSRIIVSFLLLGFGLTALFATATLVLRARIENELVEDWLQKETRSFFEFKRRYPDPDAEYQLSDQQIRVLAARPSSQMIPPQWRDLPTGVYDLTEAGEQGRKGRYKLSVERGPEMVAFIRYSYARQALDQQQLIILLGGSVVLLTLLAGFIGLWSAGRVMSPVAELAQRVRAFSGRREPEKLAPHFADDEVGLLATSLDDYADRLTELVVRDREFNADVSHELRTPLAVIRGAIELVMASPDLAPKMRQRLERIERAEQQCTHLITSLLMLSRGERGSGMTDVRRVADQLADANRAQMGAKRVELIVEGNTAEPVNAPEAVVSVALGNLIGNACKYTVEGEVRVRLDGDCAYVSDTGPGLSAEDAAHLFERGYRGSASGGTKGGGIGLSIVTRLCDLYGWQVSIAPREVGAVATLCFQGRGASEEK
ncbi:sensor histidine kinase [Coralloluteibacterium stylophorae]|uniref:histidine kinase n=1 Tax=Coralloluteibacterium stylophorae TaxID=1776034 RepID=A0A8J7VUS8_9GAMM|nr:HAMP domain-containing sensor histidine kinase [Coralloluteibacterium stylophorae]MBS7458277.1 HAMP domain-containing histidine kinase [Coralloluteibacterium stylophorae]